MKHKKIKVTLKLRNKTLNKDYQFNFNLVGQFKKVILTLFNLVENKPNY